eukprot:373497-Rhodomonas_salina.1
MDPRPLPSDSRFRQDRYHPMLRLQDARLLGTYYAMCGTDLGYVARNSLATGDLDGAQQWKVRAPYALSGTDLAYAAMISAVLSYAWWCWPSVWWYWPSIWCYVTYGGTGVVYGAMRSGVLSARVRYCAHV